MSRIPAKYHEQIALWIAVPTVLIINDEHDFLPFVKASSYKTSRNDIDGPNAGRTMDLKMHRDYLGYKRKLEIEFIPLNRAELAYIEHIVLRGNAWANVRYEDMGKVEPAIMYSSSLSGSISSIDGKRIGVAVNFIEE